MTAGSPQSSLSFLIFLIFLRQREREREREGGTGVVKDSITSIPRMWRRGTMGKLLSLSSALPGGGRTCRGVARFAPKALVKIVIPWRFLEGGKFVKIWSQPSKSYLWVVLVLDNPCEIYIEKKNVRAYTANMTRQSRCCYNGSYCDCMSGINPCYREFRFIQALRIPPQARTVQVSYHWHWIDFMPVFTRAIWYLYMILYCKILQAYSAWGTHWYSDIQWDLEHSYLMI